MQVAHRRKLNMLSNLISHRCGSVAISASLVGFGWLGLGLVLYTQCRLSYRPTDRECSFNGASCCFWWGLMLECGVEDVSGSEADDAAVVAPAAG